MKVELQHITKTFKGRTRHESEFTAVNDFNITIPDGKLVALLGPSGCGKSTMLNMICGLHKPTFGKILFDSEDVTDIEPEHRGVGMVFQNYALYPHLTVEKNIRFPLENLRGKDKLSKEEMQKRVHEVASLVQIEELFERKPGEISGGQQQRVAIARALVKMPKVLLLDEPLSNLDARLRLQTREEIRRIQKETGITTVFVTHDQDEAMSISDYIVVMKGGIFQQMGKPQEVYDEPANLFVAKFLGIPPINLFSGEIKDEKLYIGEDNVMPVKGIADMKVTVGIRPEGFIPCENGALSCKAERIEVMGRDVSIISRNENAHEKSIRSIVNADLGIKLGADEIRFDIKPHKIFVFDEKTGDRIRFGSDSEAK